MSRPETAPGIEHLIFSTRAARPASGTEFNREVIASSPGVPDEARAEFARLADMTGSVLARLELPPLWAFRRLGREISGEESWLVVRAVSLGLYRKGHHQLLVHGAVLPREAVDLLDGDPFLLATEEAARAGFRFAEAHPEGREELDPMTLDPGFGSVARRMCVERSERLSESFREIDPSFPALFDLALGTGDADRPGRRTTALAPGGAPAIEWLLLHLHPADRAELSFHTRYAYEQAIPFDLVGAAPDEVADLRRHLRGEVDVWTPEAGAPTSGERGSPDGPTLGERVRQAREREPGLLPRAIESYYLTLLPGGRGTDVRRNPFHPLSPAEADLCLRAELGLPLTETEEEVRLRLSLRGDRGLMRHAADLGNAWRRGPALFEDHLGRLAAAADELRSLDLGRMPPVARPEERLGLLALVPVLVDADAPGGPRRELWNEIVPAGTFDAVLGLLRSPEETEIGERVIGPWIDDLLLAEPGAEPEAPDSALWTAYLGWLGRAGRPVAGAAGRVERMLEALPEGSAETALDGFRRLERTTADAGLAAFALRVLFQKEVPRLPPAAARVRLGDGVAWLLREGDGAAAADAFLAPALADPETAPSVLGALAAALLASDDPAATWARIQRLLEAQPRPAPARDAVLIAAAERVSARLRARPRGARAAHGPRGVDGLVALVDIRLESEPFGEPAPRVDRALLAALLPGLVLHGPESALGATLRPRLDRYLGRLLATDRWTDGVDPAGPWRHLLLDELEAEPERLAGDARDRALLELSWKRWSEEADRAGRGRSTTAAVALARALPASAATPDPDWHRTLLDRTVPPSLLPEATHLLATLLPAHGGRRTGP